MEPIHLQKQAKIVSETYLRQKRRKQEKNMHELVVGSVHAINIYSTVHCAVCTITSVVCMQSVLLSERSDIYSYT